MKKLLVIAGLVLASTPAFAAVSTLSSDADFLALGRTEAFVAEARYGNNGNSGDWERGLGVPDTANPDVIGQNTWANGGSFDFELSVTNGNMFSFTANGLTLNWTEAADAFDGISIRAAAMPRNSSSTTSTELSNLTLDGNLLSISTLSGDNNAEYLLITGLTSDTFTLTGTASFGWTGDEPRGSRASFQIKGLTSTIPVPGAILLGLLGLSAIAARRRTT